jgi:hypothetical protein
MKGRLGYLRTIRRGELTWSRLGEVVARRVREIPHRVAWKASAAGRASRARCSSFRGIHSGGRCVILANGPSLARVDFSLLAGIPTIGMNRGYRLAGEFGFQPTYLACIDLESQLFQIGDELAALPYPVFVNWNARAALPDADNFVYVKLTYRPRFSLAACAGMWGGHSVTYVCLQLAYHMGFRDVILVGKDHRYDTSRPPGEIIRATGTEGNHFAQGYYAPGAVFRAPDYRGEEFAYRMARTAFEAAGRRVIDATDGGALEVFPKMPLEQALELTG